MWFFAYVIFFLLIVLVVFVFGIYGMFESIYNYFKDSRKERLQINRQHIQKVERMNTLCSHQGCKRNDLSDHLIHCNYCHQLFCFEHLVTKVFKYNGRYSYCHDHKYEFQKIEEKEKKQEDAILIAEKERVKKEKDVLIEKEKKKRIYEHQKLLNPKTSKCCDSNCYEINNLIPCRDCGILVCKNHLDYELCYDCRCTEIND